MLVLSRRQSDQIVIPDLGITLKVIAIRGNTVRLGIDAPAEVVVMRGELLDAATDHARPQQKAHPAHSGCELDQPDQPNQPQSKANRRSKKKSYGQIGRNHGLKKFVEASQTDGINPAAGSLGVLGAGESKLDSCCDTEVAVEEIPKQVGEEPALYQLSF